MQPDFDVLIDSDAFVGLFLERDAHHEDAKEQLFRFGQEQKRLVTTSFVIAETATVLSNYDGQAVARRFLSSIRSGAIPIIFVSEALQHAAEQVFIAQENKHTSMVDCCNVAVMQQLSIPAIWSFDTFYFKKFHLQRAA
jgi:predicted nucleic acid-binding protein